jgi:hypothetical protein
MSRHGLGARGERAQHERGDHEDRRRKRAPTVGTDLHASLNPPRASKVAVTEVGA